MSGLQELEIESTLSPQLSTYEYDRLALLESTLAPQSDLEGSPIADINFREKYGLELVGLWLSGKAIQSDLDELTLEFGDALLLLWPRAKLGVFSMEDDFIAMTTASERPPDTKRAPLASLIMLGVVGAVMAGVLPIAIAAVLGATIMVITGCLNMEQALSLIHI